MYARYSLIAFWVRFFTGSPRNFMVRVSEQSAHLLLGMICDLWQSFLVHFDFHCENDVFLFILLFE